MEDIKIIQAWVFAFLVLAALLVSGTGLAANCNQKAKVVSETTIWDSVPAFNVKQGWRYGKKLGTLMPNTRIYICKRTRVGFGVSTRLWYSIAFWNGSEWDYGWIENNGVEMLSSAGGFSLFSRAQAQAFGSPPQDMPPPPLQPASDAVAPEIEMADSLPNRTSLYIYLFIAMLVGMVAKVGFDISQLQEGAFLMRHIKRGLGALFVSPIVYLSIFVGLGSAINIHGNKELIVLMIFAFQNGFFWQNIFAGNVSGKAAAA